MVNESAKWLYMLDKAAESKQDFLDYLMHVDKDIMKEAFYDEIISWDEDQAMQFVEWWDWDLDLLEDSVWQWCELVNRNST